MKFTFQFHNHASVSIGEPGKKRLLFDPWHEGEIFNDSWRLLFEEWAWSDDYHLIITHEHPDHLHFPTLKKLEDRLGQLHILYPHALGPLVPSVLEEKFRCTVIRVKESCSVAGMRVRCWVHGGDSAWLIWTADGGCVLNYNDCKMPEPMVREILEYSTREHGRGIDILCGQFSIAGYGHDPPSDAQWHKEAIAKYQGILSPDVTVPTASFVEFCADENQHLNQYRVRPGEIENAVVMAPGGEIPVRRVDEQPYDSSRTIDWWDQRYDSLVLIKARETENWLSKIELAAGRLKDNLDRQWLVGIRGLHGGFEIGPEGCRWNPNQKPKVRFPATDLLYAVENPWGADTANITGTAEVDDFAYYRQFLYALFKPYENDRRRVG